MKRYDNYVVVVPLKGSSVLVQRQYKPGIKKFCWGFPAGFVNKNEDSTTTARRELFEETGLVADKLTKLGKFYDNVSVGNENFTIYLAEGVKVEKETPSNPDKNEGKIINKWIGVGELDDIEMPGACMSLAKEILLRRLKLR